MAGAGLLLYRAIDRTPRDPAKSGPRDSSERQEETREGQSIQRPTIIQSPADGGKEPPKDQAILEDEERAVLLSKIEQFAVTYDAKALPEIEPYLLHPDPDVRAAALNGMIILGDAAAAPLLRKAADKAPSPKEAVALTEAADYVELPSGTFIPKERAAPGTRKPRDEAKKEPARRRLTPKPAQDGTPVPAE